MSSKSKLLRVFAISLAIVFALNCFSTAEAQSGRRTPKSKAMAYPNPEPEPTPTPATSTQTSQPVLKFILGMDQRDGFTSLSFNSISGIMRSCAQRLDEPEWIRVEVTQRAMLRSDAIKLAKTEKDSYVVWLRVPEDRMSARQTGTPNNAYIEYTVFAPATAKIVTSGSTYPQNRNQNVILGRRTSDIDGDYYLNKAAREAADRILAKFGLHAPRRLSLAVIN